MSRTWDTRDPDQRDRAVADSVSAIQRGELVVLPTDTVYGVGVDAFSPQGITALLAAKGRGRDMPVPVLVGSWTGIDGLVESVEDQVRALVQAFWPGGLTLVVRHAARLAWDLGDAHGTVAVRMPLHPVALEVLRATGPLGVSSANVSGQPPAPTAGEARAQLGDAVAVYLEAGPTRDATPSSIVDCTGEVPRLLRAGAVPAATLREVVPDLRE